MLSLGFAPSLPQVDFSADATIPAECCSSVLN
jgi:hypothetical protein